MPPAALFKNETTRRAVLAAAMLMLLLASFGGAYLYTKTHHHQPPTIFKFTIGRFTFLLPENWEHAKTSNPKNLAIQTHIFRETTDTRRTLYINLWESPNVFTPDTIRETLSREMFPLQRFLWLPDDNNDCLWSEYVVNTQNGRHYNCMAFFTIDKNSHCLIRLELPFTNDPRMQSDARSFLTQLMETRDLSPEDQPDQQP